MLFRSIVAGGRAGEARWGGRRWLRGEAARGKKGLIIITAGPAGACCERTRPAPLPHISETRVAQHNFVVPAHFSSFLPIVLRNGNGGPPCPRHDQRDPPPPTLSFPRLQFVPAKPCQASPDLSEGQGTPSASPSHPAKGARTRPYRITWPQHHLCQETGKVSRGRAFAVSSSLPHMVDLCLAPCVEPNPQAATRPRLSTRALNLG